MISCKNLLLLQINSSSQKTSKGGRRWITLHCVFLVPISGLRWDQPRTDSHLHSSHSGHSGSCAAWWLRPELAGGSTWCSRLSCALPGCCLPHCPACPDPFECPVTPCSPRTGQRCTVSSGWQTGISNTMPLGAQNLLLEWSLPSPRTALQASPGVFGVAAPKSRGFRCLLHKRWMWSHAKMPRAQGCAPGR